MTSNNFANDGSFMAQFMAQQGGGGSGGSGGASHNGKADIDRSPQFGSSDAPAAYSKPRPRFTEEGTSDESSAASRSKRKFVESDETDEAAPRSSMAVREDLDGEAYDPGSEYNAAAADSAAGGIEQDELVMSEWGKKYKVGYVPKSSHVGNLLPADEMAKYTTMLPGAKPVEKKEEKDKTVLDSSNKGHQLLSKMGWKAGKGLGAKEDGKVAPVGAQKAASDKSGAAAGSAHGVGSEHTWDLDGSEDVFEQYRKRMMLGYRHRPNPNGNPRKLYY